jgi:cold shock CspA family protein
MSKSDRGFCFLKDAAGRQYFAHVSSFKHRLDYNEVDVGTRVTFEVVEGPKGPAAACVELA